MTQPVSEFIAQNRRNKRMWDEHKLIEQTELVEAWLARRGAGWTDHVENARTELTHSELQDEYPVAMSEWENDPSMQLSYEEDLARYLQEECSISTTEEREVPMHWILVSELFCNKLADHKEVVLRTGEGSWWGTYGGNPVDSYVLEQIQKETGWGQEDE